MLELLKKVNEKAEQYRGRGLLALLLVVFVIFSSIGAVVGFVIGDKSAKPSVPANLTANKEEETFYEGRVSLMTPGLYPGEDISYALVDSKGKEIILLRAADQKLEVSEGHYVAVYGEEVETKEKKKVLIVDRLVIKGARD